MKVCMVGSGNVATVLSKLCLGKGHRILQVISRESTHAEILANELGAYHSDFSRPADDEADIIIIAVSDNALASGHIPLKTGGKLLVHTAGSVAREKLDSLSPSNGILYPLQTLRKEMPSIPEIPFLIDASDEKSMQTVMAFAKTLSSEVRPAGDEDRLKLHLAAVVVNNFTNHLYVLAEDYCKKEKLDFSLLFPLIRETAMRVSILSPSILQTGPALRNDIHTIDRHLEILAGHKDLKEVYRMLTDAIGHRHK